MDWGDGTHNFGAYEDSSVCHGNNAALPGISLSHKYENPERLDGSPRRWGVTLYLCSDPGEPAQRCCDSIYRVVQSEDYDTNERCSSGSFDMEAFMDVENNNTNSCVSIDATNMTFSNSCFDAAPPVMIGDCDTGVRECDNFTPISDVLAICDIYLEYSEPEEYYRCVERFTEPLFEGTNYRYATPISGFLTREQRSSILCCARAHADDDARGMDMCSTEATEETPPKEKSKGKKTKGAKSRIRTRGLRKKRSSMTKIPDVAK